MEKILILIAVLSCSCSIKKNINITPMNCPDITRLMKDLKVYIEKNNCSEFKQCFQNSYFNIDKEQLQSLDLQTARSYVLEIYAKRGHRRDGFTCGRLQFYFDALSYSIEIRHLNEIERIDHLLSRIKHKKEQFKIAMNGGFVANLEVYNKELMLLAMSFPSQESYLKELYLESDDEIAEIILKSISSAPIEHEESKIVFFSKMKRKRGGSFDERLDRCLQRLEMRKKLRIQEAARKEKYRGKT